jgi:hypothetical protein
MLGPTDDPRTSRLFTRRGFSARRELYMNHWQEEEAQRDLQRERNLAEMDRRNRDMRERQAADDQQRQAAKEKW